MSLHIRDDFKPGAPISQVPASWFNKVANFINNLVGVNGVKVTKNENGPSYIELSTADGYDEDEAPVYDDVGSFPDDVTQSASELWNIKTANGHGCKLLALYKSDEATGGIYNVCVASIQFGPDGRLQKIEAVEDKGIAVLSM